jgi:ubiquinone/menaquinone biosynthesis C-methylase UbiE
MFDPTQPEQFKRATRSSFDNTSPAYGTNDDFHWQFAARLVGYAPIAPGQHLLDIGTGTAPAARLAAHKLGKDGHVFAADLSLGILRLASHNIHTDDTSTISLLCADAEYLPVVANSVDGILCSSAIVWLPNYVEALHDWHRALRPHGWLVFSCFGGLARQTVITLLSKLLKPYGQILPELNAPFNTPEKCRTLLTTAGYLDIRVIIGSDTPLPTSAEASFAWAWAAHTRFGIQLSDTDYDRVRHAYIDAFSPLVVEQEQWNHDYEQFILAYKPR